MKLYTTSFCIYNSWSFRYSLCYNSIYSQLRFIVHSYILFNDQFVQLRTVASFLCYIIVSVTTFFLCVCQAAKNDHVLVVYEIALSMQKLASRMYLELHFSSWDLILDILNSLFEHTGKGFHGLFIKVDELSWSLCACQVKGEQRTNGIHSILYLFKSLLIMKI